MEAIIKTKKLHRIIQEPTEIINKNKSVIFGHINDIFHKIRAKNSEDILHRMIKSCSTRINDLARTKLNDEVIYKTELNRIDYYFTAGMDYELQKKLQPEQRGGNVLKKSYTNFVSHLIKKDGFEFDKYDGHLIFAFDKSAEAKRSRAIYKTRDELEAGNYMEFIGRVHDGRADGNVVGYETLMSGFAVKNGFIPTDFFLNSNTFINENPDERPSVNTMHRQAIDNMVKIANGHKILLLGDREFSAKDLLCNIKSAHKDKLDFLMRIKKNVNIYKDGEYKNIVDHAKTIKKTKIKWKKNFNGEPLWCDVCFYKGWLYDENSGNNLEVNVIYSMPTILNKKMQPLLLVTTLPVNIENLRQVLGLYKKRWKIETTFEYLKQKFGFEDIMVRHWESIKMMISFMLFTYLILFICFATKVSDLWLLRLIKKYTTINNELTFGKFIWLIIYIFDRIAVPAEILEITAQ